MRFRAFKDPSLIVDVAQGDILQQPGNLLIIGKPKGLRVAEPIASLDAWETLNIYPRRQLLRFRNELPRWQEVYSFNYHASSRARLPTHGNDWTLNYWRFRNEFEWFLVHLSLEHKFDGSVVLGLVPFSWRNSVMVAHAMTEALAGFFFGIRLCRKDTTAITVVIRSLDEPTEFYEVFDRRYFKEFRTQLGWPRNMCDVWSKA